MKERSRTPLFILVQPSSRATSSPFPTRRVSLKKSPRSVQYNTITLAHRKTTLHLAAHSLLHKPNYKPYVIWVTNAQLQITNPM